MSDNALYRKKAGAPVGQVEQIAITVDDDLQTTKPLPDITTSHRTVNTLSPTAILKTDGTILFDSSSNNIAITLPLASVGKIKIPFKDIGGFASTNDITISRAGSDTIVTHSAGQTAYSVTTDGDSGALLSNGIDTWYLLKG